MSKKSLVVDYTSGPLTRQLLAFAGPFMLSNLFQTAYNMVDMVVVGQYVGAAGLSAVSIGGELIHFYTFITMGLCNAGQIMISQYIGLRDRQSMAKTVGAMFSMVLGVALLITAVGLGFNPLFLRWLNVPAEAWADCLAYTNCCTAGCVFMCGYLLVGSVLRGMGDSRHPMIFVGVAAVLNVVLDIWFVSAGMGAFGAALATVIAQGVSFVSCAVFLYRRRADFGFEFKAASFRPEKKIFAMLIKLGVPMVLQSSAISISTLFVSSYINQYGVVVSAVTGVGSKLSMVVSVVTLALSHSGGTIVGQNFAARKFDRVKKVQFDSYIIGCAFAALLSVIIALWPEQVFSLFDNDPEVLAMSRSYVPVAVVNFFGWALRGPAMALCNGMGFVSMNFILGILDGVVMRIGLSLLLGQVFGMGVQGFWMGGALAGSTFFVVMFPYLLSGKWKKRTPPVAA